MRADQSPEMAYLVRPGTKRLQLGNFYVATVGAKDWTLVKMSGNSFCALKSDVAV